MITTKVTVKIITNLPKPRRYSIFNIERSVSTPGLSSEEKCADKTFKIQAEKASEIFLPRCVF